MNAQLPIRNSQVRRIVKQAKGRGWTFWIDGNKLVGRWSSGVIVHTHCHRQVEKASSFRRFAQDIEDAEHA